MKKYYTRACNFHYGSNSRKLINKRLTLPLCGNKNISFNKLEIFTKNHNKISSRIISLNEIKYQSKKIKKKINSDIKKITSKRKYFKNYHIMGILNMTPDSFSDGGKFIKMNKAYKEINKMVKAGAEIIDIGGESTRPGSKIIPDNIEWNRVKKVIKTFKKKYPDKILSIDTRKSKVMKLSIKYKVDIINDVSCFDYDMKSINIVRDFKLWKVIHHMQGNPQTMQIKPSYKNVLLDIYDFFEEKIKKLKSKSSDKIILDPGIGFGKNLKHNLMLMNKISIFHSFGFPILIGTSRKRFINQISKKFDTKERLGGTLSSVLFTLSQGVQIFRVHNVNEVKQGILVYKKLLDQ
ncbi:MAG: dihydropteroate synthase [Pelagibacteraceae bacterium]